MPQAGRSPFSLLHCVLWRIPFSKYIKENFVLVVDDFSPSGYRSLPPEYTLICQAVAFGQGGVITNSHHSNANTFIQLTPMSKSAVLSILSGLCGSLLLPQVGQIPSCRGGKRHGKASSQTPWITQPGARLRPTTPSGLQALKQPADLQWSWLTDLCPRDRFFFPLKSKECRWKVGKPYSRVWDSIEGFDPEKEQGYGVGPQQRSVSSTH